MLSNSYEENKRNPTMKNRITLKPKPDKDVRRKKTTDQYSS